MDLSFTEKKSIRKSFGKLKEILSIPNLIEVQKKSYNQFLTSTDQNKSVLQKGLVIKGKAQRMTNYVKDVEKNLFSLLAAIGCHSVSKITR